MAYITDTAERTGKSASDIASRIVLAFADDHPRTMMHDGGLTYTARLFNAFRAMEKVEAARAVMAAHLRTLSKAVAAALAKGGK